MALAAALTTLPKALTGFMEHTVIVVASLAGLQEIEPGWVLANGALLPVGTKYDPLRTLVGTNFGANGTLPNLLDGVQPIGKGPTNYTVIGATDGAVTVALATTHITPHAHSYAHGETRVFVGSGGFMHFNDPPGTGDGGDSGGGFNFTAAGGGGAHNNMPLYQVVEGVLVKL